LAWLVPAVLRLGGIGHSVSLSRVTVATVTRGTFIRDVAADGKVVAAVSPTLYAPDAGTVTLKVQAGATVTKGEVLASLVSPDLAARLSQEQASLESQQIDWHRAELDAARELLQVQDTFSQAQVDQKTAERELDRSRKAFEQGSYSELQMLKAQDALEKANFTLEQARKNLAAQPQQNAFEIQSKKALAERQQLVVKDLQRQIEALDIRSPVDGQVGAVQIVDRATVAKDAPLLTVVDLSALEVEIQVPEGLARDLAVGMGADLSGNGGQWNGIVSAVSPEVVNGQVVARVRFGENKPVGLRQSQRLSVRILLDQRANVLMVDRGAFLDQDGGNSAYFVHDNVAEKRPIRAGSSSVNKVEILEGVREGDRIVISGSDAFDGADRVVLSQ